MGLWGVLLEIARAVVPHAAPHVARAVVDAAKERRAASEALRAGPQAPSNDALAGALAYLEKRLSEAEERAATAEERLSLLQAQAAHQQERFRRWMIALLAWNAVVTAVLIYLVVMVARK